MPGGDGAGPTCQGLGRGRMGEFSTGPGEKYVCPSCGTKADHQIGVPCYKIEYPKCRARMVRERDGG